MSSKNMTAICSNNKHGQASRVKSSPPADSLVENGVSRSGQHGIYDHSSLKRTLTNSQSSASLSAIQGSNFQDNDRSVQQGAGHALVHQGSSIPISRSGQNLLIKSNGRSTIAHEPGFRERLPSFTVRERPPQSELQTHFAVYKFVPRHPDELLLNVGDAVCVKRVDEDLWCEGKNLRTGESGMFPSRYVSDILSHVGTKYEFSENGVQFFLRFLGSVEVFEFKGNTILCQAIVKILGMRKNSKLSEIPPCSLEIDYRGIKLVNHAQDNEKRLSKSVVGRLFNNEQKVSNAKFFFKLKDVTFCGCYPNSPKYFGFVTKHPSEHRFACHTFMSEYSTEPVAKAIGQAFRRFSADVMKRSSSR